MGHESDTEPFDLARVIQRAAQDGAITADDLMPMVYGELRALAGAIVRDNADRAQGSPTLQPTALVHEAWMKLQGRLGKVEDRHHFFALAAMAMRQVLADYAKGRRRIKRGGGAPRLTLVTDPAVQGMDEVDAIALYDSLEALANLNERHARVVELRIFGALSIAETADVLGVSAGTVKSDWSMARAWLLDQLSHE